jgi:hypothetical protein
MPLILPHVLYTVWCLSKSNAQTIIVKKQLVEKKKEMKKGGKQKRKTQRHR